MSIAKYSELWEFLNQYEFEFNLKEYQHLKCIICQNMLRNAYQGPCGCRYCFRCIEDYFTDSEIVCPGNADDCPVKISNLKGFIQPDHPANRSISAIRVKCPFDFCNARYELCHMREHIQLHEKCPLSSIGCRESVSPDVDHFLVEMHNHSNLIVKCLGEIQHQLDRENSKIVKFDDQISQLQVKHDGEISRLDQLIRPILTEFKTLSAEMKSLSDKSRSRLEKLEESVKYCELENLAARITQLEADKRHFQTQNTELEGKLNALLLGTKEENGYWRTTPIDEKLPDTVGRRRASDAECNARKRRKMLGHIEHQSPASGPKASVKMSPASQPKLEPNLHQLLQLKTGPETHTFAIHRFSHMVELSRAGTETRITCEPFDTVNRYRVRLIVYPNGVDDAVGDYLSVAIQSVGGAIDDQLQWPMEHNVTFSLVNQIASHAYFSKPSVTIPCKFVRVSMGIDMDATETIPNGPRRFIKLQSLFSNPNLLKDDSIIVRLTLQIAEMCNEL